MSRPVRPLFAANWKMHKTPAEAAAFAREFCALLRPRSDRRVVVFPPSISMAAFRAALGGRSDVEVGVQDVHSAESGAHTGAISASMAADAGAGWGLAGHSERRHEFGDDDLTVALKTRRLLESGLRPIVCLGETLEQRRAGALPEVLARQVGAVLEGVPPDRHGELTYAYEPVWAIGTGRTATPGDASEAHALVREQLAGRMGAETAAAAVIVYGGSVKPANIDGLLSAPGIDGVLVGGASLVPSDFAAICGAGSGHLPEPDR